MALISKPKEKKKKPAKSRKTSPGKKGERLGRQQPKKSKVVFSRKKEKLLVGLSEERDLTDAFPETDDFPEDEFDDTIYDEDELDGADQYPDQA